MMSNPYEKIKIVKLFASSEYKIRNNAYKSIVRLLKFEFGKEKKQLSAKEILAIWKGLYVWLWMQDKPILHEEVVGKISSLLSGIASDKVALEFMRAFFITMDREWSKIDVHRLDKYYMLVRQFFAASLRWLSEKRWAHIDEYLAAMRDSMLQPGRNCGIGLRMHFLDIVLDELCRAGVSGPISTRLVTEVILSVQAMSYQQILVQKMRKRVIDRLESLQRRGQLQIDLRAIGQRMLVEATASDDSEHPMTNKTRKLFYGLAQRFRQCAPCEGTESAPAAVEAVDQSAPVAMETDDRVQPEPVANEEAPLVADNDDVEMEQPPAEEAAASSPVAPPAEPEATQSAPSSNKKQKQQRKKASRKASVDSEDCHKRSESEDKRVTFGKRYIKRFSKGTTNISVSQGTVKQDHMKSILKK